MTTLRLIADDLTGALDTAAEFVPLTGAVSVYWNESLPNAFSGSAALDSGTREKSAAEATTTVSGMARHLSPADIAYKKIDSLLRGHTMAELAACWGVGAWDHCIVAPAFPHEGRITKRGIQLRREASGNWTPVSDLMALATAGGLDVQAGGTKGPLRKGVYLFDAETNEDLSRIADCGRAAAGRVLGAVAPVSRRLWSAESMRVRPPCPAPSWACSGPTSPLPPANLRLVDVIGLRSLAAAKPALAFCRTNLNATALYSRASIFQRGFRAWRRLDALQRRSQLCCRM